MRVFSPSRDAVGRPLRSKEHERVLEQVLCSIAGGFTSIPARGTWVNKHGERVREQVTVIEAYLPDDLSRPAKSELVHALEDFHYDSRNDVLAVAVDHHLFHFGAD